LSGSESGRLRKAPKVAGLRVSDQRQERISVRYLSGRKRDASRRTATGGERASAHFTVGQDRALARELRSGRPGRKPMDCQAGLRLRPKVFLPEMEPSFGSGSLDGGNRDPGSGTAERRTARAPALTGSPRGNRKARKRRKDPGGSRTKPPARLVKLETAQADCLASQAWFPPATGVTKPGRRGSPLWAFSRYGPEPGVRLRPPESILGLRFVRFPRWLPVRAEALAVRRSAVRNLDGSVSRQPRCRCRSSGPRLAGSLGRSLGPARQSLNRGSGDRRFRSSRAGARSCPTGQEPGSLPSPVAARRLASRFPPDKWTCVHLPGLASEPEGSSTWALHEACRFRFR